MSSAHRFLRVPRGPLLTTFALLLVLAVTAAPLRAAVSTTQTITLQPGWNSIFLEVTPTNPAPAAVFAGLPVDQVWAFFPAKSSVQYLSDPAAGLFNVPGWNVYLPTGSRPDAAYLTDLKGIIGHQAYLVKNTSTAAATLTVTGTAGLQGVKWNPDSYTLTGLAVDPTTTVRSGDFFASSPAHAAQPRYRLDPNGTWVALTDAAALAAGQAYWVFTKGGSDFSAPLEVSFGGGRTLDFGPDGESARLTVRNRSAYAVTVNLTNPGGLPLSYELLDPAATVPGNVWKTLPAQLSLPLPLPALNGTTPATTIAPGQSTTVTVGVRRAGMTADVTGFIRVASSGVALSVPVAAQLATSTGLAGRAAGTNAAAAANANAGLWIGTATLNAVSEANTTSATPTATAATFALRLLIHVDANGAARLLKEITLMKGRVAAGQTPPLVLVSDLARLSDFDAPTIRDGSPFANRISAIGFDFAGASISLGTGFGTRLNGVVTIGRDLPTNPFKHKYHPDHDDLNAQFQAPAANLPPDQQEVWGVTRTLQLTFDTPPANSPSPSSGYSERTGTYTETLSGVGNTRLPTDPNTDVANPGLHKRNIVVSGPFTLRRGATRAVADHPDPGRDLPPQADPRARRRRRRAAGDGAGGHRGGAALRRQRLRAAAHRPLVRLRHRGVVARRTAGGRRGVLPDRGGQPARTRHVASHRRAAGAGRVRRLPAPAGGPAARGDAFSRARPRDRHLGHRRQNAGCGRAFHPVSSAGRGGANHRRATTLPPRRSRPITPEDLARECARLAAEKKAEDLVVLDLRGISTFTDYYVICSGSSEPQLQAIASEIRDRLRDDHGVRPAAVDGFPVSQWVVMDYLSVLVHIFHTDKRGFYALEDLWSDAPRMVLPAPQAAPAA